MPARWFLDACVLVPQLPREIILGAADAGLVSPFWSARVLEEWRIAAARRGGIAAEAEAVARARAMESAHPGGRVALDEALEQEFAALMSDRADAHVAAGAASAGARVITFNLRDFPARRLAGHGIDVSHPDAMIVDLMADHAEAMEAVMAGALALLDQPPADRQAGRGALKRSGLPRSGKAWAVA